MIRKRFSALVETWIWPVLQGYGFYRVKDLFVSERGYLSWCVEIQRGKWRTPERMEFTFNVGVCVPGVVSLYLGQGTADCTSFTNCCIHTRIGMLYADKTDKWWSIGGQRATPPDDKTTGEDVCNVIRRVAIPFLDRFRTRVDVLSILLEPPTRGEPIQPHSPATRLAYAAILFLLEGDYVQCRETMDRAVLLGEKRPGGEHLLSLRERLIEIIARRT